MVGLQWRTHLAEERHLQMSLTLASPLMLAKGPRNHFRLSQVGPGQKAPPLNPLEAEPGLLHDSPWLSGGPLQLLNLAADQFWGFYWVWDDFD